jgi:hypothetical protein
MISMRKILFVILLVITAVDSNAQPSDSCFYIQFDFANRWVWRGVSYSEAPVIQPVFGYANNKFNAFIFGSYPFERRAYSEIDFTAEYFVFPQLKLGFTDYFAINDSVGSRHSFFDFERKTTMHMFDIYAVVYPFKQVPLSLLGSFWFWGADRESGTLKQNYSTYFELKYEKKLGFAKASIFVGATPMKGFYAKRAAIVNLGIGLSKELFANSKFSIPARVEFVLNPELQNAYVNAIISIK